MDKPKLNEKIATMDKVVYRYMIAAVFSFLIAVIWSILAVAKGPLLLGSKYLEMGISGIQFLIVFNLLQRAHNQKEALKKQRDKVS